MTIAQRDNWPAEFTVYSRDEYKQDLCRRKFPNANYVLGDVRDKDRLEIAITGHDIICHAAALKYVDRAETSVNECISTNIEGSRAVINAARRSQVHTVIGISTDKAVEPINVYGLSKALMERLWTEAAREITDISFVMTRYGNVLHSTGSVVPLFKRMAAETGEVTVTNPNMTRYWLSIDEAVNLVVEATKRKSGTIVIPRARAMTLANLVKAVAPNARIKITGLRPGEKNDEKLLTKAESTKSRYDGDLVFYNPDAKPYNNIEAELVSNNPSSWIKPEEFSRLSEEAALI